MQQPVEDKAVGARRRPRRAQGTSRGGGERDGDAVGARVEAALARALAGSGGAREGGGPQQAGARRDLREQLQHVLEPAFEGTRLRPAVRARLRAFLGRESVADIAPARLIPLVFALRDSLRAACLAGRSADELPPKERPALERLARGSELVVRELAERESGGGGRPSERRRQGTVKQRSGRTRQPGSAAPTGGAPWTKRLVSLLPDAVVTLGATQSLGTWSAGASRLTGRRRREVQRRGFASLFREPEDLGRLLAELDENERITGRELSLVNAAGDDVPVRIFAARLPEGRGRKRRAHRHKRAGAGGQTRAGGDRYLLVLHDLTELHRIRRRLIETEKLSAMAKIAGSVAHEFRNPLNSLFLNTDLLEDELEGSEDIQASIAPTLSAIREEIERLNQIITHYLSLSKIATAAPEPLDLDDLVSEFVGEWGPTAKERGLTLRYKGDGDEELPFRADPGQVRRVLVNLVENAFDALEDHGDEEADGRRRSRTVTLLVRRLRNWVKLTVKDNGPGIPEELADRAFEPFLTSKSGGSGLGLYLVREIVLAAGGTIGLNSQPGRGTTVSVRWPLVSDEEGTSAGARNGKP